MENRQIDPRKFVYFDLGNVLVHFDHDIAVRSIARLSGHEAAVVKEAIFASGLQDRLETGLMTSGEFAQSLIAKLACKLSEAELLDAISAIFTPNEPILVVLEQLKRAGVPMAVLSNTCEPHWGWLLQQNWPVIGNWFDFYVLSYEARSMKPDSVIYQVSEQRSGREPKHLFFTDDRADNIAAAAAPRLEHAPVSHGIRLGRRAWPMARAGTHGLLGTRTRPRAQAEFNAGCDQRQRRYGTTPTRHDLLDLRHIQESRPRWLQASALRR